jgi:signal transduction histidine kinase
LPGSRTSPALRAIARYALATAAVAGALGLSLVLGRILPFTFFLGAVALSAWFGGTRAGFFSTLLSIAAVDIVLAQPPYVFGMSVPYIPRIVAFTLSALLLLWVIAARHRAEDALIAARDELDEKVRERTASLVRANEHLQAEIDERMRSERRLAAAAARLARARRHARERVLAARFAAVLEERTRLAREIHDTLLQGFTGVSLQLLATAGRMSGAQESRASLDDVLALAQKTLADARQAVWDMRPPALESDDFAASLGAALDSTLASNAVPFEYAVRGMPRALEPEVETAVFRIAQEAVANTVKHASARAVRVVLSYKRRSVRLCVRDDGCGFILDPDFHSYAGHWGLLGMRERASQLRATLKVRTAPDKGTVIVLRIPIPPIGELSERATAATLRGA